MTCATTRQRLLGSERPDRPPADIQPHLAACPACREWQRRLTRIEQRLPDVPVPPSAPPEALLRQLLNGSVPPELPGTNGHPWWVAGAAAGPNGGPRPWWVSAPETERPRPLVSGGTRHAAGPRSPHNDRTRRKVAVAFAATLGLAVFSLCWGVWPHSTPETPTPPSPVAVREARLDRLLAEVRTPRDKVHVLDAFAGKLHREAHDRARTASPAELRELAAVYVHTVRVKLPAYARSLPVGEREKVLSEVADSLLRTNSEMERLLDENVSPDSAKPLREIAEAALEGHNQLRAMLREV